MSMTTYPLFRFRGTHGNIGLEYGRACNDLIQAHLRKVLSMLRSRRASSTSKILATALLYRPIVVKYAPYIDEELQGIAKGASISLAEAYILQLRAELRVLLDKKPEGEFQNECTTFAILPEATSVNKMYSGQNADLPHYYTDFGVVVEFTPNDMPAILMLTFAGQVAFVGINEEGVSVFGNYLKCDGWRIGFPRYLLSRIILAQKDSTEATALVSNIERASSRNLLIADSEENAVGIETTASEMAAIRTTSNYIAHTNHFVSRELQHNERAKDDFLYDSETRLSRINELIANSLGEIDLEIIKEILQNRKDAPNAICREPEDNIHLPSNTITVASVIAELKDRVLWVSRGSPRINPYMRYDFATH